jgi:AcrR family transcriptional regulator
LAIIVDKEQKKRDIALACKDLILTNGINNITVSQVAKTAGIGKGTVYEYFANKDEIVFELVNILMLQHSQKLQKTLQEKESTKEKIREFSRFFYSDEEQELRKLYKEFIALSLIAPKNEMVEFHAKCTESYFVWFYDILQDGIEKGELHKEALLLAKGLFAIGDGIFVQNSVIGKESEIQKDLDTFIDTLFELMERK